MEINGFTLKQTCVACPEQYDVYDKSGSQIGYLRLRHGSFRADYLDCGGEIVYHANPNGDGIFEDDERDFYLGEAVKALQEKHKEVQYET